MLWVQAGNHLTRTKQRRLKSGFVKSFLVQRQLVQRFVRLAEVSKDIYLSKWLIFPLQGNQWAFKHYRCLKIFANTNNLIIVYYALGPVLAVLHVFSHLILTMTTWDRGYCQCLYFEEKKTNLKKLSKLSNVTKLNSSLQYSSLTSQLFTLSSVALSVIEVVTSFSPFEL